MILLTSANDTIKVITGAAVSSIEVQASYVDLPTATQVQEPNRSNTVIATATTTTVVASPAALTHRAIKDLSVYNSSASLCEVTIIHDDGTTAVTLYNTALGGKASVHYNDAQGFYKSVGINSNVVNDSIWDDKGDLVVGVGEQAALKLIAGSDGQYLTADSNETVGLKWDSIPPITSDPTFTAKGDLIVGTGVSASAVLSAGTDGYSLVADSLAVEGVKWADAAGAGTKQGELAVAVSSSLTFQGLTFTAVTPGVAGDSITITLSESQAVTGIEFSAVGNDITISTENAASTYLQGDVDTAFASAPVEVNNLVDLTIANAGTALTGSQATTNLAGGVEPLVFSIRATKDHDESADPLIVPNFRGEWSVDLQTDRDAADEVASGTGSSVLGGFGNKATNTRSVVTGGNSNVSSGVNSVVSGGTLNVSSSTASTISGGSSNNAAGEYTFVGGGLSNICTGNRSVVTGGISNNIIAGAEYAVIAGGRSNSIPSGNADESVVVGGESNSTHQINSVVVGGWDNDALQAHSVVVGGYQNDCNSEYGVVGGGLSNILTGNRGVISGGNANNIIAGAEYSVIVGGRSNSIPNGSSDESVVVGGESNATYQLNSVVVGGWDNDALQTHTVVVGGYQNDCNSQYGVVGGGVQNVLTGNRGFIGGGQTNNITSGAERSVIVGGDTNSIPSANADEAVVVGGESNSAHQLRAVAVGGWDNDAFQTYSIVVGGYQNDCNSEYGVVGGGVQNVLTGNRGFIGGGKSNNITSGAERSVIVGGDSNSIPNASGDEAVVVGGESNSAHQLRAVAVGGWDNDALQQHSVAVGGYQNDATATHSVVVGGYQNNCNSEYGFIGGGVTNVTNAIRSVIAGGQGNAITAGADYSTLVGGISNAITAGVNSVIVGGQDNSLSAESATVVGGYQNEAGGLYSTVTGGIRAKADKYGQVAHAAGMFTNKGDAQKSTYVVRALTNDNTESELFLDGAVSATLTFQGLTFTAVAQGPSGDSITVELLESQAVTGIVFSATGNAITISTENAATTYNQGNVEAAFATAPVEVTDLVTLAIADGGTSLTGTQAATNLSGGAGGTARMDIADNSTWFFSINLAARRTDGGANENALYKLEGGIENTGGITSLVGVTAKTVYAETDEDWDVTVEMPGGAPNALVIRVTGELGKTIRWVASVETTEVMNEIV